MEITPQIRDRAWSLAASLIAAIFIPGLVFLFLPSEILLRNLEEFTSTPGQLLPPLALWTLLTASLLFLPALFPVIRWQRGYSCLLGGLAPALWISSIFLVPGLGGLDGMGFDPERQNQLLNLQGAMFILILAAAWIGMRKWPRYLVWGLLVLTVGLATLTGNNFYAVSRTQGLAPETIDVATLARFSSRKNLLVVVLDSFQSDILHTLVNREPALQKELDGFVYFPDTLGVTSTAYLTVPAFQSGQRYNDRIPLPEFYTDGVGRESFLGELAHNGYRVDIINPFAEACPSDVRLCGNQEALSFHARQINRLEASRLADRALLRIAPGPLKAFVFDGKNGLLTWQIRAIQLTGSELRVFMANRVLREIAGKLQVDDGPPTARLIHLPATNPPFMFDGSCRYIGIQQKNNRQLQTGQARCTMEAFLQLLSAMKKNAVYDNSTIVLTAYTGSGDVHADDDLSSLFAQEIGTRPGARGRLLGEANPVLAVKLPGARGGLTVSDVQAQLTDIPRTVCQTLNDCDRPLGNDLRDPGLQPRARPYFFYPGGAEQQGLDRMPGMLRYTVRGPLWMDASWSSPVAAYDHEAIFSLAFSPADDPAIFGPGWDEVEVENPVVSKRWAMAQRAALALPLAARDDLILGLKVLPAPGLDSQSLTLRLNGRIVGTRDLEEGLQEVFFSLPGENQIAGINEIALEFSTILPPQGRDLRELAAAFYELTVLR